MRLLDDEEDEFERSMLEDMQLAAELGKTLLDRNRELESTVREQQATIEDQAREIEYLTKQTAALREVNDSRLGIYEHLEASITELERSNHRLVTDAHADKKLIRNLSHGVETLEARCEELQRTVNQWEERAQNGRLSLVDTATSPTMDVQMCDALGKSMTSEDGDGGEMSQLLQQIQDLRAQRARDRRKIEQLEEETAALAQENLSLEEQLAVVKQQRDAKSRSLEEEVQLASDGNGLCVRCLAVLYANDAAEGIDDGDDEDETNSMASGSIISQTDSQIRRACFSQSPYQTLVDKFEALLQVQRKQFLNQAGNRQHQVLNSLPESQNQSDDQPLSLQEELQMSGDFSGPPSLLLPEEDDLEEDYEVDDVDQVGPANTSNDSVKDMKASYGFKDEIVDKEEKATVHLSQPTPETLSATNSKLSTHGGSANHDSLHYYEAETASSGFSDEPIGGVHRSTQTDEYAPVAPCHGTCHEKSTPSQETSKDTNEGKGIDQDEAEKIRRGTLLCKITEGEDCHVSIYDEALPPTKSRFVKNHPSGEVGGEKDASNGIVGDKHPADTPENRRQMFREIFAVLKRTLMEARESAHLDDVVIDGTTKSTPADASTPAAATAEPKPAAATSEEVKVMKPAEDVKLEEIKEGEKVKLTPYRKANREDVEPRMGGSGRKRKGEGRRRGGGGTTPVPSDAKAEAKPQPEEPPASPAPEHPESTASADECQTPTNVKRRHHRRGKHGGGKALLVAAVTGNHQRSHVDGGERCSWPMGPVAASSPSAEMARLMRLERSYADALRLGAPRKEPTQVWGRGGGGGYRGAK
ncbi:uro-adherence factor A isoform X2 [Hetaerina americana]|uniref:uro-adherence factor A isoform X2 n=1 Tax=Hetaerina americana TaxID=62018 RepID=UPI003A7F3B10